MRVSPSLRGDTVKAADPDSTSQLSSEAKSRRIGVTRAVMVSVATYGAWERPKWGGSKTAKTKHDWRVDTALQRPKTVSKPPMRGANPRPHDIKEIVH